MTWTGATWQTGAVEGMSGFSFLPELCVDCERLQKAKTMEEDDEDDGGGGSDDDFHEIQDLEISCHH